MNKAIISVLCFLLVLATASATWFWYSKGRLPGSNPTWVVAPKAKVASGIKTSEIKPDKVIAIDKPAVIAKMKLPDWVKDDPNKQALATGKVGPYEGDTNTVALLDTKSGITDILSKQEPLPFMNFENKKEVYVRAGYDTKLETQVTVGGRWKFLRVAELHMGIYGEVSSRQSGEAVAGIEISY